MYFLENDHGHPLPETPVFYSILLKTKKELHIVARANRNLNRVHMTIPYILACLIAYLGFFQFYLQTAAFYFTVCALIYGVGYVIRWFFEPQYALFILRRRPYFLGESDKYLFFSLYGLEDEAGSLTQANDRAVLAWIERCKDQLPADSPILDLMKHRKYKEYEERKYIPVSVYELVLRQLSYKNVDILKGLDYYDRSCDIFSEDAFRNE